MRIFHDAMLRARELTLGGKLMEATLAIQQGLGLAHKAERSSADDGPVVDMPHAPVPHGKPVFYSPAADVEDVAFREFVSPEETAGAAEAADTPAPAPVASSFSPGTFESGKHRYPYKVFVPSHPRPGLPVVVMLHGCKQDAADFAAGTAMNAVAEREKFIVVYPEQLRQANSMGCWNWFEPAHQARGEGEPAMIAALASHIASLHRADPARIYIAGLSAGGAMAALAGKLYPEVFAAVGVHSGLAPGAARDVASAFTAMRRGPGKSAALGAIGLPTIIFQGSGDKTVSPANADAIAQEEVASRAREGIHLSSTRSEVPSSEGRESSVVRWTDQAGTAQVEIWTIQSAPHAWAGGDAAGSFTDPKGPNASQAMVRFFMRHSNTNPRGK
ncbi:alpha/beta hydrolase family esterase [Polaromonas sp. YR568]|uniref:extracellular catalytic domain type 1 short-chain-length polyhydroxyalkanoate depolymerase n=1 Tax=Polaromonas sp. YR568 TaxID=1855301 RepID=UPI00398BD982